MSHVSAGRITLTISVVAALITGPALAAAASQDLPAAKGDVLIDKAHPCTVGNQQIDAKYCHDAAGKASSVDPNDPAVKAAVEASKQAAQAKGHGAMTSRTNLICLDHTVVVRFDPKVTKARRNVLFAGAGAFDKCSSPSKKSARAKSARLVITGSGNLALESAPGAPGSRTPACHAAGALSGTASLIWYDQEGQQGNPVGTTKVDFVRKAGKGPAANRSTGKVTQTSPGLSELQGNEVSSTLKPRPGQCPASLKELQVELDATFTGVGGP